MERAEILSRKKWRCSATVRRHTSIMLRFMRNISSVRNRKQSESVRSRNFSQIERIKGRALFRGNRIDGAEGRGGGGSIARDGVIYAVASRFISGERGASLFAVSLCIPALSIRICEKGRGDRRWRLYLPRSHRCRYVHTARGCISAFPP